MIRTILECKFGKRMRDEVGVKIWLEPYWNVNGVTVFVKGGSDDHLIRTILECKC